MSNLKDENSFLALAKGVNRVIRGISIEYLEIISVVIIACVISFIPQTKGLAEDNQPVPTPHKSFESKMFVVTAYYTPLKNQSYYISGSFESDSRMNGNETTATGDLVRPGVIAAPKTYPFGTKIYLDGIGTGIVLDRGGAIVSAGLRGYKYDRLDLWVGFGDEGLQRAKHFGKRTVSGDVYYGESGAEVNISLETFDSYRPNFGKVLGQFGFERSLVLGSTGSDVYRLNSMVRDLGYLDESDVTSYLGYTNIEALMAVAQNRGYRWWKVPRLDQDFLKNIVESWVASKTDNNQIWTEYDNDSHKSIIGFDDVWGDDKIFAFSLFMKMRLNADAV